MLTLKKSWKDPLVIALIALNLYFVGYTVHAGWNLVWPTVSGTVTSAYAKAITEPGRMNYYGKYLLLLTYTYNYDATLHENTEVVDQFESKELCDAVAARYQGKTIKVYINPFNHNMSILSPGKNFFAVLITSVLAAFLSASVLFKKSDAT